MPLLAIDMIGIGERSGSLREMLNDNSVLRCRVCGPLEQLTTMSLRFWW